MINRITTYVFTAALVTQLAGCGGGGGGSGDAATPLSEPVTIGDSDTNPSIPSVDVGLIWNASNWDQHHWQ